MSIKKHIAQTWARLSLRAPWKIIAVLAMITAGSMWMASGLSIRGDFAALLPKHYPSVKGFDIITQKVGGLGFLIVVVESADPESVSRLVLDLAPRFGQLKDIIRHVQIHRVPPYVRQRALYFAEPDDLLELNRRLLALQQYIQLENRRQNPLVIDLSEPDERQPKAKAPSFGDLLKKYGIQDSELRGRDLIGTSDGKLAVMLLQPTGLESDLPFIERMETALKQTVAEVLAAQPKRYATDIKINYSGRYMVRIEDDRALRSQIAVVSLVALFGVLLLIFIWTRRKRSFALIGLPLLIGIIWTAGISRLLCTNGELNIITTFIIAILLGLGIDFGIHLFSHYQRDRCDGLSVEQALANTLSSTGSAGIVAVLTSASAFLVIQLTDFKGLSQFGLVAGVGLIMILLAILLIFPPLTVLFERKTPLLALNGMPKPITPSDLSDNLIMQILRRWLWIPGVGLGAIALVGGSLVMITGSLRLEYDLWRLIAQGQAVQIYDRLKKDVFRGETEPGIMLLSNHEELQRVQNQLTEDIRRGRWTTIRSVYSIHSLVPPAESQLVIAQILHQTREILSHRSFRSVPDEYLDQIDTLRQMAAAQPYSVKDLPTDIHIAMGNGHPLLFILPSINPTQIDKAILYAKELQQINEIILDNKGEIGDSNLILADMFRLMARDGPRAVLFALLALLLVLLLERRKQLYSILFVLSPLAVGFTSMILIVWLFDIRLNPFNVIMLPVTVGIGIDHGVYLYYHWEEKGYGPVIDTLKPTFIAVLLSALTSLIGFSSLALAGHQGIRSIGILAALGIICTTAAAFIVLPSLLVVLRTFKKHHHAKIISNDQSVVGLYSEK